MLHTMMAAALQDVQKPVDVAAGVRVRVCERIPHAGLCGKVDDAGRPMTSEELGHRITVADVSTLEDETRLLPEDGEPGLLERYVVVVVYVVDADHLVATVEKSSGAVEPDESRGAGDEDLQAFVSSAFRISRTTSTICSSRSSGNTGMARVCSAAASEFG